MNPRRNLQTRKNRRKRNERWWFKHILEPWLERDIHDAIRRLEQMAVQGGKFYRERMMNG